MAITYPLSPPASPGFRTMGWSPRSVVAVSESPFSLSQQVYVHQGAAWSISVSLPPMVRDDAEGWVAWKLALNGREGTFTLGDPKGSTPRGTIAAGGIAVLGAHAARSRTIALQGGLEGATVLPGDYIQLGAGSTAKLHKNLTAATFDASGHATLDIWPPLRGAVSDAAEVVTRNCVGLFRMTSNVMTWDIDEMSFYGIDFQAMEAL